MESISEDVPSVSRFGRYMEGIVEGLGDPRVSAVLAGPMATALEGFVRDSFLSSFEQASARLEEPFEGFPDDVVSSPDPVEAAILFVAENAGQHQQTVAMAFALAVSDFVVARRAEVIEHMKAAGDEPLGDRPGRMAGAARQLDEVRSGLPAISAATGINDAETVVEELRSKLEQLRDELSAQVLDDAIVWGARFEAEEGPRPGVPELASGGRRIDVEDLLVDSWLIEMDMHLALAAKVGAPVTGRAVASEDQREFVLDALVAIQEAFSLRSSPEMLLKFGDLRLAKGDVGEARMVAEKVMEMVPDEESPIHVGAQELFDAVTEASPLTRRDRRCFIATAAMGDGDASEVETLRVFRDEVLLRSGPGSFVVECYYWLSPPLADVIASHAMLRAVVKSVFVRPLAGFVSLFVKK